MKTDLLQTNFTSCGLTPAIRQQSMDLLCSSRGMEPLCAALESAGYLQGARPSAQDSAAAQYLRDLLHDSECSALQVDSARGLHHCRVSDEIYSKLQEGIRCGKWECNTWTADLFAINEGLLVACDSTLALKLDHDLSAVHALWRPLRGAVFSSRFGDGTDDPAAAFPLLGWHRIIIGRDQLLIRGFVLTTAAVIRTRQVLGHQSLGSRPRMLAKLLSACASFPKWACPGRIIIPGGACYRGNITLQTFDAESIKLNPALYEAWSSWQ